ncbi:nuclear transport factor 2 family protein [Aestuariibacter halophilus]|uniref:Nuclear transport factor 2 family protein n=1 Tax=Fluctibacter halophilus TaxID=226011 RepID=A0ABS8GC04_9ALTE|nr:nuclear transport factor 2 family protein [Aestuariibacter halophilus]MCC2616741.1 nuclear transport factor 2 family protein [Aestuariibacter halophilus]
MRNTVKTSLLLFTLLSAFSTLATPAKTLVQQFYQRMFVMQQVDDALNSFVALDYIQHNPYVATGREPLRQAFQHYFSRYPDATVTIKRIIAEQDLVVVHSHWKTSPEDRGNAVIDIFRVEGDLIVEHWDTVQAIPEQQANDNGMF